MSGIEIWLCAMPFGTLFAIYCWDTGLELIVP